MVLSTGAYQYHLKDHLGNTRAMFSKNAGTNQPVALAQATDYYPFGKSFEDIVNGDKTRYLYNGKEFQNQVIGGTQFGWYDYGARFYDPEIARWHSVDPLAFITPNKSTYLFVSNNPINRVDPLGLTDYIVNGETKTINDGHNDLRMDVSEAEFKKLERKFDRGGTGYERYMNKLSTKNGFTTIETVKGDKDEGILDGVSITQHKKGGDSYSEYKQEEYGKISLGLDVVKGSYEIANADKLTTKTLGALSMVLSGAKVAAANKLDGGKVGYNTQLALGEVAGSATGAVGGILVGQEIGGWIGGGIGFLCGGYGAIPGVIIGKAVGGFIGGITGGNAGGRVGTKVVDKVSETFEK